MSRKPYPKEFREQVVKLVQLGDRSALGAAGGARPGPPSGRPEQFREGGAGASATGDPATTDGAGDPVKSSGLVRSGDRFDRVDVPRAGRLPQRLLRVAGAPAEPAGGRERGVEPSDHGDPRRVAGDLRGAAAGGAADALAVALGLVEEDGGGLLRLGMTSTW